MDKNRDGIIDKEELVKGFDELLGVKEDEVERIIKQADADGNGELEYSEWVIATINKRELLSDDKLLMAFQLFDQDGGGSISAEEIKEMLGFGKNSNDKIWDDVVNEVDDDGDGEIVFEEFKEMMQRMIMD